MGSLLSLGVRAMTANYAALQTTGNNISNANTAGYSRQSVQLETAGGQFSGAGFFGKGVNVTTVARAHDEFLTREAATTRALAASSAARSTQLQQLEKVFEIGEAGIGHAAGQLFNSFVDVANNPQDLSARQVVLSRAGELASRFRTAGNQINTLQANVTQDLRIAVTSVNSLARQIADLNVQIAAVIGSGHAPNDLLDQRDTALSELSELVQVSTIAADDGSTSVFIGGSQQLVLGGTASTLTTVVDVFDPSRISVGVSDAGGERALPDALFTGGAISGLLQFQREDLNDARNLLGQMAMVISEKVNEQQALGLTLGAAVSGSPIFSVSGTTVAPSSENATLAGVPVASYINGSGDRVPSVSVAVSDATELRASDYELVVTAPGGPYQLTRLSDDTVFSVSDGDVVDGFTINVAAAALPAAGDRFRLTPVGSAARTLQTVLSDPRGIAAASPVTATVDTDNTGTATVAALRTVTSSAASQQLSATITFTDDAGAYDWELRDSTNTVVRSGTGTWTAGTPIRSADWLPAVPTQRNDWEMTLSGVPRTDDVLNVQTTAFPASNNGNANAMMALRDAAIVGQQTQAGPPVVVIPGDTVTDAYANVLADIGVRVQRAKSAQEQTASIASDARERKINKTGVNLDEEAARLIQYQQSYQAAAKMLQVAQSIFDTLLETTTG
jgi:flagellar hook-associated protein 1 FlgK